MRDAPLKRKVRLGVRGQFVAEAGEMGFDFAASRSQSRLLTRRLSHTAGRVERDLLHHQGGVRWRLSDRRLLGQAASVDALRHPDQGADIFAETGPQKCAAGILAEPVDPKMSGGLGIVSPMRSQCAK